MDKYGQKEIFLDEIYWIKYLYRVELKSDDFYTISTISRIVSHFLLKLWLLGLHLFTKNGTSLKILKENQRPMYFNNLKKKKNSTRANFTKISSNWFTL